MDNETKTIPGSLFGKRIKVVQEAEDLYDTVCVCPHCGEHVTYGHMTMVSGTSCCPLCLDELHMEMDRDKEKDYEIYRTKDYEPFGVPRESHGA